MTRKAIVTGGAGFVGSHLTEVLLDREAAFNFAMEILQHVYRVGQQED